MLADKFNTFKQILSAKPSLNFENSDNLQSFNIKVWSDLLFWSNLVKLSYVPLGLPLDFKSLCSTLKLFYERFRVFKVGCLNNSSTKSVKPFNVI